MKTSAISLSLIGMLLAACAEFPDLTGSISDEAREAPFPDLWSFDELDDYSRDDGDVADTDSIIARAAALQDSAVALGQPVIDDETRDFLTGSSEMDQQ